MGISNKQKTLLLSTLAIFAPFVMVAIFFYLSIYNIYKLDFDNHGLFMNLLKVLFLYYCPSWLSISLIPKPISFRLMFAVLFTVMSFYLVIGFGVALGSTQL